MHGKRGEIISFNLFHPLAFNTYWTTGSTLARPRFGEAPQGCRYCGCDPNAHSLGIFDPGDQNCAPVHDHYHRATWSNSNRFDYQKDGSWSLFPPRNHYIACAWFACSDMIPGPDTWVVVFGVKDAEAWLSVDNHDCLKKTRQFA